jgi:hypothetical protein
MKVILSLLASLWFVSVHAEGWPGLSPDCWSEPRNVHSVEEHDPWQKNIAITQLKSEKLKPGVFSPNKGYFFLSEGSGRPEATIKIYAEKDHLTQIKFTDLFELSEIQWINEKLLFIRPWWGRIVGTDIIYDVEKEKIIYAETITDGSIAYTQFKESCPQQGCECIKYK